LLFAAAVLAACGQDGPAPGEPAAPSPVSRAPGAAVEPTAAPGDRVRLEVTQSTATYPVFGSGADEILSYIEARGPVDDRGQRASGVTHYSSRLDWRPDGNQRSCAIDSMTIFVDLQVILPALDPAAPLGADVRARWAQFAAGVAAHEQRHVDIYLAGVARIRDLMLTLESRDGCLALESQVNNVWDGQQRLIDSEQEQFHIDEKRRVEGLRAPIRSQIEGVRAQLDGLAAEIRGLDSSLVSLAAQLSAVRELLNSLSSQLRGFEASSGAGGTLAPDQYQQYESLRNQYNNLIPSHNALVDQYNLLVSRRAGLAQQSESLQAQVNKLVDDFNWTR
jgi:predicted secreted Zn-dependent protease